VKIVRSIFEGIMQNMKDLSHPVQPEAEGSRSFLIDSSSQNFMLKGVFVKICLPVVLGFVDALQVSLQIIQAS